MIRKANRILAALLAALMTLSITACGGTPDDSKSETSTPAAPVENPMAPYEEEVVVNMGRQTGTNPRLPDGDTFEDNAYTRFLTEQLNIKIQNTFEANGADYDRQVSLAMASGELPDIMLVSKRRDLQDLAENDMIADLTDVYNQYASENLKAIYKSYDDVYSGGAFAKSTIDGKIFGMPNAQGDGGTNIVWVRKDWTDKLGITLDSDGDGCITTDELKNVAKEFVAKDPGGTGKPVGIPLQPYPTNGDNDGGSFTLTGIATSYGAFPKRWTKDADGKIVYGSLTAESKQFLTDMAGWFKEGVLDPQSGTRTWDDCMALMVNNQAGIAFGQWHMTDWGFNQVKEKNPEAEFECYAIADKDGKVNYMHVAPRETFAVVSKDYEHPEVLIQIMNLFYDDLAGKQASTLMPNIDDAMKMDNSTRPLNMEVLLADQDLITYQQISAAIQDESKIDDVTTAENRKIVKEIQKYQTDPAAATTEEWAHYNSRMKGLGLYSNLTEKGLFNWTTPAFTGTTDSMTSMWTNIDKLESEMVIKVITGVEQPEYFDTFMKDWKAQGGDTITEEIEAQLAEQQ